MVIELSQHQAAAPPKHSSASPSHFPAGDVAVGPLPRRGPGVRADCRHLVDALPARLGSLPAREVSGAPGRAAAWGNPPIVLRCGVAAPKGPTTQLITLDGVNWIAAPGKGGVTWTTVRREPTVRVFVPNSYKGQGPLLSNLSPALIGTAAKTAAHRP